MITVKRQIKLTRVARGRRRVEPAGEEPPAVEAGRIPRISRLMAMAIPFNRMLQSGEVTNLAELARLGRVTQPRVSQILALTLLALDIQEQLLFLPRVTTGKPTIHEKMLRPIAAEADWDRQRRMWRGQRGITPGAS